MTSALLRMAAFLLALVAGGWVIGNAAVASPTPTHCHAAELDPTSAPVAVHHGHLPGVDAVHGHPGGDHRSDGGCPTGGTCCDMFCHVLLAPSLPVGDVIRVTFASYARRTDAARGSLPARGPERPPRTATA